MWFMWRMKMFKLFWDNFVIAFFSSVIAALVVLIVTGEHWGNGGFWFNTILFTIVFFIVDLVKNKKET